MRSGRTAPYLRCDHIPPANCSGCSCSTGARKKCTDADSPVIEKASTAEAHSTKIPGSSMLGGKKKEEKLCVSRGERGGGGARDVICPYNATDTHIQNYSVLSLVRRSRSDLSVTYDEKRGGG